MNETEPMTVAELPSCSIIIPTRDKLELLKPCVDSILASPYAGDLQVLIVDNGSTDQKTLSYLDSILADARVKVLSWNRPFNFSEINNMAANQATGDVLCFLNNDIEVKSSDWLERLLPVANLPDVGAVGALLLYPDNTIQHAGVALDSSWVGLHIAHGMAMDDLAQRFEIDHWYAVDAVTAACLFTRKDRFLEFGGFDEKSLAVSFNDLDYCLRLRKARLPCLINPSVQLVHHESQTRKSDNLPENQPRAMQEKRLMLSRWHNWLAAASYQGTVPWQALGEKKNSASMDSVIAAIADIRDSLAIPGAVTANGHRPDSVEERYRLLEIDYRALEVHARNLQSELTLITGSRFWRLTAPLRRLLGALIRLKQRAGRALVSTALGRRIYGLKQTVELSKPVPDAVIDADDVKKQHSQNASAALDEFIDDAQALVLPHSDKPVVSIILVLFNQAPLTLMCLKSLIAHCDVDVEIIIVDNNSTDRTAEMMALVENATTLHNQDNVGFVHAVNQGAEAARGDFLLFLNNDALLQPGSLRAALNVFGQESNAGAVGGKIRLLDGSLQEAGSIIWQDGSCLGYGRGMQPDNPEFMFRRDVDYCSGAFLLTPRALFAELGGFDIDYAPAYYEESDYCIRLNKAGYRIIYEPAADIIHYEFASSGGYEGASKLQQEHREILCQKHQDYLAKQYPAAESNILKARTASRRQNVLLIDDRVPHAALGAGYPRCREILHELVAANYNVTLFPLRTSYDEWPDTYATLPPSVEVMLYLGKDRLGEFLTQRRDVYDTIIVSRSHNMEWLKDLQHKHQAITGNARIVYDAEALIAPREAARMRLQGESVSAQREARMVKDELELARDADCVLAVSQAEADIYQQAGFENVLVLGHKTVATPTPRNFKQRQDFLFVGALRDDNSPNVDSLLWFTEKVLPLIKKQLGSDFRVLVVGDNIAPSLKRIQADGIKFMGRQPDITPLYDHCRVFIAPTRFAAGIPHKIHEAAAFGIPVVATELLAGQLSWTDCDELLVGDSAEAFADQCVRLYQDETLWDHVRGKALDALARDCSPEQFTAVVQSLTQAASTQSQQTSPELAATGA
ncbi:glycosyltransferase [Pseudohongiella acticola]|uniref:glycosyltransferase n=1 Tax=Pseudohongiella acticola TaxID=1524254 RepID=UPI0009F3FDC8|nr:glycosyltransferase [Pseudohongiella acticola]